MNKHFPTIPHMNEIGEKRQIKLFYKTFCFDLEEFNGSTPA